MINDVHLSMTLQTEVFQLPQMLKACIEKYITENRFRVYIRSTEFSEYARTFKVIKTRIKGNL